MARVLENWKARAKQLKVEVYALYLAYRDPRTPWYARLFTALVVAYALSPIDLIPDFIPVIGYLDDLLIVPLGIILALRMIPPQVMAECRIRAQKTAEESHASLWGAVVIVVIWLLVVVLVAWWLARRFNK